MDNILEQKLKNIGFEHTEFEVKGANRFLVKTDVIPPHLISGVKMPVLKSDSTWGNLTLYVYNSTDFNGVKAFKTIAEKTQLIKILLLSPVGDVVETWTVEAVLVEADFGKFDWANANTPNIISAQFDVVSVEVE